MIQNRHIKLIALSFKTGRWRSILGVSGMARIKNRYDYRFYVYALPMEQGNVTEDLKEIITLAAQKATVYVDNKIHEYDSLFHCDSLGCKFSALKVFENAENLQITPFYITVKSEKIEESNLWNKKVWSKANFDYMQIKFILTKYSIKAIIKAIHDTHWSLDS
jgi:hypothetical protein